jgi:hypothetical protein
MPLRLKNWQLQPEGKEKILSKHRASESNARWAARRIISTLRAFDASYDGRRKALELATDAGFLTTLCVGYRVEPCHRDLTFSLVRDWARQQ